jgi:hypothetical protein
MPSTLLPRKRRKAEEVVTCSAGDEKGTRDAASLLEGVGGGTRREIWMILSDSVPLVRGSVSGIPAEMLIDTVAAVSLVLEEIWNRTDNSGKLKVGTMGQIGA